MKNFTDCMQEYLDSSDPDLQIPLSKIFKWFFDMGRASGGEEAAEYIEIQSNDMLMDCDLHAERIRKLTEMPE